MPELMIELFSEEIPARMQDRAAQDFANLICDRLDKAELDYEGAEVHVTPRRLVLCVDGLPARQPDVSEERRGPKADAPERAVQGFLGSVGLTLEQCEKRETPKGTFLFAQIEKTGAETADLLPDLIIDAIRAMPWPKSMRWARNRFTWVRPLHHVLAIFGGETLNGALDLGDWKLEFTNITRGHRFLAPEPFAVSDFEDYKDKMARAFVMLDRQARTWMIREQGRQLVQAARLTLREDPGLLEEVAGLVEWPVPLLGKIENEFMELPVEVLVTSMRSHQKYFATETEDGELAPVFMLVSNMANDEVRDQTIISGNEKVLRARLSDAKFFWDQDKARRLEDRVSALAAVTFYDKLGNMAQKVDRVRQLSRLLAGHIPGCDVELADRAALLAKADLTTGMVGEFPELQGIMGRYYARHDSEVPAVANAIADHYSPQGPSDDCPRDPVSVAVALADKLDALVGFFAIAEKPTGSRDPFALRRAALGVIRLVMENKLRLPLGEIFSAAAELHGKGAPEGLLDFFADRLKVHLREAGTRHDLVSAVFALDGEDDILRLLARVDALTAFLETDDGANLLIASRRGANILRAEEKKDGVSFDGAVDRGRLELTEETTLVDQLEILQGSLKTALASEDFAGAMQQLAGLRAPIDAFFDQVTVNAKQPELRINRLALLGQIRAAMGQVAEFSQIEG